MLTQRLLLQLLEDPGLISLARQLESGTLHLALSGITPAAKPAYLALFERLLRKPILFVGSDNQGVEEFKQATAFYQRLVSEETARGVAALPATEPGPYSGVPPHAEVLAERALALWEVLHSKVSILLCPPASFMARLPDLERAFARIPCLQVGSEIEPHRLMHFLVEAGYVREEPVTTVGSFSIRGGVFDIFPPIQQAPSGWNSSAI